jgi:hypothetical protein
VALIAAIAAPAKLALSDNDWRCSDRMWAIKWGPKIGLSTAAFPMSRMAKMRLDYLWFESLSAGSVTGGVPDHVGSTTCAAPKRREGRSGRSRPLWLEDHRLACDQVLWVWFAILDPLSAVSPVVLSAHH